MPWKTLSSEKKSLLVLSPIDNAVSILFDTSSLALNTWAVSLSRYVEGVGCRKVTNRSFCIITLVIVLSISRRFNSFGPNSRVVLLKLPLKVDSNTFLNCKISGSMVRFSQLNDNPGKQNAIYFADEVSPLRSSGKFSQEELMDHLS